MVDLHAENLASRLLSPNSQDVREQLKKKLRSFAEGEIPHAANAVSEVFGILARYRASKVPLGTNEKNLRSGSKCTWAGGDHDVLPHRKSINIALIKSMHRGSFLDMEYSVRKQRIGMGQFATLYLSSSIFHSVRSKLDARRLYTFRILCVNRLLVVTHTFNSVVGDGDQEVDEDSDYEEDSTSGFTETGTNSSGQEGRVPRHNSLPGALTT